jgi:hypothetical protein
MAQKERYEDSWLVDSTLTIQDYETLSPPFAH